LNDGSGRTFFGYQCFQDPDKIINTYPWEREK
jgi:hypothetical protein